MVDHLAPAVVRSLTERIATARSVVSQAVPESRQRADDATYWQEVFEANAAAVLASLSAVRLRAGSVVRYRFYGRRGGDLLVRPFVAHANTDVSTILRVLDWHPPPDAGLTGSGASRDVELLYRHFEFTPTPEGYFEYWAAMQELWASQRWIHSTVIADAEHLAALTAREGWRIEQPVARAEPAVVVGRDGGADIAVLLHCPIDHHTVTFHRVCVGADQSVELAQSLLVAHGPRGYRA